jgi:hypothetical protein
MTAVQKQLHTAKKAPLLSRRGSLIHPGRDLAAVFPDLNSLSFSYLVRIEGKGLCYQKIWLRYVLPSQSSGGPYMMNGCKVHAALTAAA